MIYSLGISWIDDTRIPHNEEIMIAADYKENKQSDNGWGTKDRILEPSNRGRFTPNLLVCDDMLNDGSISKSVRGRNDIGKPTYTGNSLLNSKTKMNNTDRGFDDKGTNSRYYDLDKWFEKLINEIK